MGRHKPKIAPVWEYDWMQAIPLTTAVQVWPVTKSTCIRWANEGKIAAWKPNLEWFVSVQSLLRLCGIPKDDTLVLDKLPSLR